MPVLLRRHIQPGLALFCVAVVFAGAVRVNAEPVQGIMPAVVDPIAVPGGVLMMPLVAQRPGDNWPATLTLTTEDGRSVQGEVAWLQPLMPEVHRHWTDDPRHVIARAIQPTDDSSRQQTGSPVLLARLPSDVRGTLQLGRITMQPIWHQPVAPPEVLDPQLRVLPVRQADDLPDPESPLEHWRWIVMADALRMTAPDTSRFDPLNAMLAEHQATLWRIGLNRLRGIDQSLAERCTRMLLATGFDRDHRFATWVADPVALDALLRILLETDRAASRIVAEVESWIDSRRPVLMWPVSLHSDDVELALVNRLDRSVSIDLSWQQSGPAAERLRLPAGVLSRLVLERPQSPSRRLGLPTLDEPVPIVLEVSVGRLPVGSLTFPPAVINARPPGVFITTLFPPLTLADVERARQSPVPAHAITTAHIRRIARRWEIFIECRRPSASPGERPVSLDAISTLDAARRIEAITMLIGRDTLTSDPPIILTIPERGWWRLLRGRQDGALQIHRRSYDDRWYCRVVLPDAWVRSRLEDDMLLLGLARTHSGSDAMDTAPDRRVPWRTMPGQLRVDLSHWDDLPRYERAVTDNDAP